MFAAVLGITGPWWAAVVCALLGLLVLLFFRDPHRSYAGPVEVVVAPADGVVTTIDTIDDQQVSAGSLRRIVTFLSVFDVHVQRSPVEGEVVVGSFRSGRKVAAFRPDADLVNANHLTVLRRAEGDLVGVRQIAGLVARRVVPYLKTADHVSRGGRLGVIKFGSRVDLLLPPTYEILVHAGDRLRAGETPVAMPTDPSSPPPVPAGDHP